MAKVILEFDYHEDRSDIDLTLQTTRAHLALWDITNYFRALSRGKQELPDHTSSDDLVDILYSKIHEIMDDQGVDLNLIV